MIFAGLPLLIFAPVFLLMLYTTYLDIYLYLDMPDAGASTREQEPQEEDSV